MVRRGMLSLGVVVLLFQAIGAVQATGTRKVGPFVVITNDKPDGRQDVAVIVSGPGAPFGLAIRCIDATLSVALVPLKDEGLFGARGRSAAVSVRPAGHEAREMAGRIAEDRALYLAAPAPMLGLVLATQHMAVSVLDAAGAAVETRFDLRLAERALGDLVGNCPVR
ncbi:hypothetical protein [Bosea psychrotolerans]|uniref:Uncharacterized protein n=1 Tax=Bosea psychrotolerans TaxID=1871628 RepID=A0A2S4LRU6_9HYPH|nr:hypothetical protein [Bosea psychrotolerans]POR45125.1 hypothetical protein CYD53_1425 [Bosea psychrotolerans]